MPTYQNDSDNNIYVLDKQYNRVMLRPDDSVETWCDYSHVTGLTETDATIYNPVLEKHDDLSGTSFNVELDADSKYVLVASDKNNPNVTMLRGALTNTPGETILPGKPIILDVKEVSVGGHLYFTCDEEITAGRFLVEEHREYPQG